MKVSNWANYPVTEAEMRSFSTQKQALDGTGDWEDFIPRGLGRCYGDSALNTKILSTLKYNRFLDFDPENGILSCQAGVSFEDIIKLIVPKGWFLPVTPGTKFVTLGGAIAADVHGKNHHSEGSFSRYLLSLDLMAADGTVYHCTPDENADIFHATCGGMGLTGIILQGSFQLKKIESVYIVEESIKAKNLDVLFPLFEKSAHYTYSVAWIDCLARGKGLGKGILLNGEHAGIKDLKSARHKANPLALPKKRKVSVPLFLPSVTMNGLTIKAFNKLFYAKGRNTTHIVDYDTYFYPLDGIHHWNRVYGKRGFAQYQFVIPPQNAFEGLVEILEKISSERMPSFLTVLKTFGPQNGVLSFPMEGFTMALDFPLFKRTFGVLDELDEIVKKYGGRLYLTKDSRMKPDMLRQGYPRLDEFLALKQRLDSGRQMQSMQSKRMGI